MVDQKVFKFESSDKQHFQLTEEDVDQSVTLYRMVEARKRTHLEDDVIPLRKMSGDLMKLVVKWFQMHRIDAPSTSTWPEDYLKSLTETEFDKFMWAAEYLKVLSILALTKREMMRRMKLKRPADYKRIFESDEL